MAENKHDAVRDGRNLMENDEALLGHPASVYSIGDGSLCSGVCIATSDDAPDHPNCRPTYGAVVQREWNRIESDGWGGALEHPNYRYPHERTGDSTI